MRDSNGSESAGAARDALLDLHQKAFANAYSADTVPRIGRALVAFGLLFAGAGVLLLIRWGYGFGDRPLALAIITAGLMLATGGLVLTVVPRLARTIGGALKNLFPSEPVDPEPWKKDFFGRERGTGSELGGDWKQHASEAVRSIVWSAAILLILWAVLIRSFPSDKTGFYFAMGVIAIAGFWRPMKVVLRAMRARRYGNGQIEYDAFPFFTGERLVVRIKAGGELASQKGEASLRCIRRYRGNKGRTREKLMYQQAREIYFDSTGEGEVRFDVPADAPPSQGPTRRYGWRWVVRVRADLPGVDYDDCFAVPVYAPEAK